MTPSRGRAFSLLAALAAAALLPGLPGTADGAEPSPPASAPAPTFRDAGPDATPPKTHSLRLGERWLLNLPGGRRFDASALLLLPNGDLLTVNDKSPGIYRIDRHADGTGDLVRDPRWFTPEQLAALGVPAGETLDLEGLSRDGDGRLYLCEESHRWVLRADPRSGRLERLAIDWKPVRKWFSSDLNASWEGIAAGTDGRLYLANERSVGRVVTVDLASLQVVGDFQVAPVGHVSRDFMYSDLCWHGGELWVLCRQSRRVVRVDPVTHRVLADFDYTSIELSPEHGYAGLLPYGQFEGLAVDAEDVWLLIDNNGGARIRDRQDTRPTLFRCPRPDRARP